MNTNEREFSVLWLLQMAEIGVVRHLTMAATGYDQTCSNRRKPVDFFPFTMMTQKHAIPTGLVEEYPPSYYGGYIVFGTVWKPFLHPCSCRREAAEIIMA